jgi:hypothetical protein
MTMISQQDRIRIRSEPAFASGQNKASCIQDKVRTRRLASKTDKQTRPSSSYFGGSRLIPRPVISRPAAKLNNPIRVVNSSSCDFSSWREIRETDIQFLQKQFLETEAIPGENKYGDHNLIFWKSHAVCAFLIFPQDSIFIGPVRVGKIPSVIYNSGVLIGRIFVPARLPAGATTNSPAVTTCLECNQAILLCHHQYNASAWAHSSRTIFVIAVGLITIATSWKV